MRDRLLAVAWFAADRGEWAKANWILSQLDELATEWERDGRPEYV